MRRWLIAAAAMLTTAVSVTHADYVIIRVYSKSPGATQPGNNNIGAPPMGIMGFSGVPSGIMGFSGVPKGALGQPPVGPVGFSGPATGQFGNLGATGQPPLGAMGFQGNRGLSGGGPPPGMGVGGQPPRGAMGFQGNRGLSGGGPPPGIGTGAQPPLGGAMGFQGNRGLSGGGPPPGIGAGGQPPPLGAMGFQGNRGLSGGGPPPGIGAGGQPPPLGAMGFQGNRGLSGGGPPPAIGAMGFMGGPPVGALGGPVGVLGGPAQGFQGGQTQAITQNDYVTAVIEVKKWRQIQPKPLTDKIVMMDSNFGSTALFDEDPNEIAVQFISSQKLRSPSEQYTLRRKLLQNGKDRGPDRYLDEARWCLTVGLTDKCIDYFAEIEKLTANGKNPSERVAKTLELYRKIKPILEDEVIKKDKATSWKERLGYKNVSVSAHYALVHSSDDTKRDGIERRLQALENNFKTFYLLFALQGRALPAPEQKLVAVLIAEPKTFIAQKQIFNVDELVSDGFYARQENLAIFSPIRTDLASRQFEQTMQELYRSNQDDLINGKFPPLGAKDQAKRKANEARRAQTLALVECALREESEIAAATHEGTLQLVAETQLLPRNAPAPEWLRFGLASLFEMPKGPFPGKSQAMVRLAFWPGAGGPNWAWRLYFNEMLQDGQIPEKPTELFYETLTDAWFDRARDLELNKKEGEDVGEQKAADLARARTLSWALTFYLFNERFREFEKFLAELSNLPRDTEIDHYTLVTTFLKTFGYDASGLTPANPKGDAKLERYGGVSRSWVAAIGRHPLPTVDLNLEKPTEPTNPNQGFGPGGIGPMPPGGIGPMPPAGIGPGGIGPGRPGGGGPGFPGGRGRPGLGGPMG